MFLIDLKRIQMMLKQTASVLSHLGKLRVFKMLANMLEAIWAAGVKLGPDQISFQVRMGSIIVLTRQPN